MKKKNSFAPIQIFAIILVAFTAISSFAILFDKPSASGGGSNANGNQINSSINDGSKTFTVETEEYKDLQKFAKWVDSEGNTVSTKPKYKYVAKEEKELTAVYENIDFVIAKGSSVWDSTNHTLTASKWSDVNYLEYPLTKGMSVTFDWTIGASNMIGLATSAEIANPADYVWDIGSYQLFTPTYNMYFNTDIQQWGKLYTDGRTSYTNCSIPFFPDSLGKTLKVKYVLADKIEMYIDDVLVTTSATDFSFDYAYNDTYYLTYWGTNSGSIELLEFGWDIDSQQVFKGVALESNYYSGKKISFLGDSITCGVGATNTATERYSTVLSNMLGATENNMGNSGWVIATGGVRNSQLQNISKIPTDSSLVVVMLGTNDQNLANNSQYMLGKDGDTVTTTVWGAAETMCKQLAQRFEGKETKIIICTPPIQRNYSNDKLNGAGYSLRDISNVLMTCARRNGLLYADVNDCGYLTDSDMNDQLHPNTSGHEKIAQYLAKYILSGYEYYTPYKK